VLVLALKTWLEQQLARVSTKSVIAEVIRYGLNHWDGLVRFLDDGRIELDTTLWKDCSPAPIKGLRTGQRSPRRDLQIVWRRAASLL